MKFRIRVDVGMRGGCSATEEVIPEFLAFCVDLRHKAAARGSEYYCALAEEDS